MDATETDDPAVIGEAAHIVGEKEDGPRGISPLTLEQRNKYANLILLCSIHHKQVDDQVNAFPVDRLVELKSEHELWVRRQLDFDVGKLRDDELYADYIERWSNYLRLDKWLDWTSWILDGGQPCLSAGMKRALDEVRPWLLSRVWPGRYLELEDAFTNFRHVAQDLCLTFEKHAERPSEEMWRTAKFYKIDEWNPDRYRKLADEYDWHVALVEDLLLELTRAANYVCDKVRQFVLPSFRVSEGVLLVRSGPYGDWTHRTHRVEYGEAERTARPYTGVDEFITARFTRDVFFGERTGAQSSLP